MATPALPVSSVPVPGRSRLSYVGAALAPAEQQDKPWFLDRLQAFATYLGIKIRIFSGSGGPSVRGGGGFAGDPHDRQIAVDATDQYGRPLGTVAKPSIFAMFGLRSGATFLYKGQPDVSHVDAVGFEQGAATTGGQLGFAQLAALWVRGGGPKSAAPLMAAVALAESRGRPTARLVTSREDSRGLWQINVKAHPEYARANLFDPLTNAQAAVAVWASSGPGAWSTYTSGAYKSYVGAGTPGGGATGTRPDRPGGGGVVDSFTDLLGGVFHFGERHAGDVLGVGVGGALGPFGALLGGIKGPVEFYKFLVALLDPVNWLRGVELLAGLGLLVLALRAMIANAATAAASPAAKPRKSRAARVLSVTPAGRVARVL